MSANAQADPDEKRVGKATWAFTIVAALGLVIGLFFVVPVMRSAPAVQYRGAEPKVITRGWS